MNITKAQFKTSANDDDNAIIICTIDGNEWSVPLDPANRHYAAILEWAKEDGNEIQEAE